MSIWRRALCLFLLMVFTPVSAMAGTSLGFCTTSTGNHRAVEFVLNSGHHSADEGLSLVKDSYSNTNDCSDRPLLTNYHSARAEQAKQGQQSFWVPALPAKEIRVPGPVAHAYRMFDAPVPMMRTDPRLLVRQGTILLV